MFLCLKRLELFLMALLLPFAAHSQVQNLTCEGLKNPLGIETLTPHFSWQNVLRHRNQRQKAYQIQVSTDSLSLAKDVADLWDSGQVESEEQIMVEYEGKPLNERQLCYWRVRTWDEKGRCTAWSGIERFAVGIMSGMQGEYVGLSDEDKLCPAPMLRKNVRVAKNGNDIVFAHVNSLGYHEFFVNGERVGDEVLQPAVSQLEKHSLIVTYDITPYIHDGDNEIMLWIGQGWNRQNVFPVQYDGPMAKAEICGLSQGKWQTLAVTDASWQASPSGYSYTGTWLPLQFGGERYDANVKPEWRQASVFPVAEMRATPQQFEGNHVIDSVTPVSVARQADGSLLLDFGRVMTGWLRVSFDGLAKGNEVRMEYADHIAEGGTFECQGESDIYVAKGEKGETFRNRFHYHAFRYVRVTGAGELDAIALQISALNVKNSATFECSDEKLNAIHDLVKYTLTCLTYSGYMVDCPHLERMGYGGDGNSSTMTLQTIFDVRSTYYNWMTAWGESIGEDGDLAYVAPSFPTGGGPYWCGFIIKAPWRTYQNYGDRRLIERHYDQMKSWLHFIGKQTRFGSDLLKPWPDTKKRMWFLGDWLAPKGVDIKGESVVFVSNCFICECLMDMAQMALLLGYSKDFDTCFGWYYRLKAVIINNFYHPESHTYANGTPLDQSYALLLEFPEDGEVEKVTEQLLNDCHGKYKNHIAVGLVGVPIFTEWAIKNKQADLMATLMRQTDYPGYLDMIANGATATWESWDGERSHVHNCYNGIGTWFYQAVAGIRPDEYAYGYNHFYIDPQEINGVSWVKASKPTPYGDICIEKKGGKLKVTIPVGTTATLFPGTPHERDLGAGIWKIGAN